jgi:hypothetical protein
MLTMENNNKIRTVCTHAEWITLQYMPYMASWYAGLTYFLTLQYKYSCHVRLNPAGCITLGKKRLVLELQYKHLISDPESPRSLFFPLQTQPSCLQQKNLKLWYFCMPFTFRKNWVKYDFQSYLCVNNVILLKCS